MGQLQINFLNKTVKSESLDKKCLRMIKSFKVNLFIGNGRHIGLPVNEVLNTILEQLRTGVSQYTADGSLHNYILD